MHMPNRTAKFASAILAGFIVGGLLTTASPGAARAGAGCLSGPKDEAPPGKHWYYRIDHATERHCWYLREESEAVLQAEAPSSSRSVRPVAPSEVAPIQPSVADARAELTPQARVEVPNRDGAPAAARPANAAVIEDNRARPDGEIGGAVIASCWPDQAGAAPSINTAPNTDKTIANSSAGSQARRPVLAGQFAAADTSPGTSTYSRAMRLTALTMAALALAGIVGSVIFNSGRGRRPPRAKIRMHRDPILEPTDDDRIALSPQQGAETLPRRRGFARELDRTDDRSHRIAEFFAQIRRQAPT
jgi:hypothetical protein